MSKKLIGPFVALYPINTIMFSSVFMKMNKLGRMNYVEITVLDRGELKVNFCMTEGEGKKKRWKLFVSGNPTSMARRATIATFLKKMGVPKTKIPIELSWRAIGKKTFIIFFREGRQKALSMRIIEILLGRMKTAKSDKSILSTTPWLLEELKKDFPNVSKGEVMKALEFLLKS